MQYLLDTHILLWWYLDHPDLSGKHQRLLTRSETQKNSVGISAISLWEIAKLVSLNKLEVSFSLDEWFLELEQDPWLEIIGLDGTIILESTRLKNNFPKDPSDQLIVATARVRGLKLLTVDQKIIRSKQAVVV